ncbi:hypothetical protein SLS55_002909 [Diplodia seriata]|uniref:Uncharacterized protein n=1 Tax=Diplodia seriata TaxID=420778 RepID=A0ABR3CLH0_9PEZI
MSPALKNAIFHYGQEILFEVPKDSYALVALELIAGYQPLALVSSRDTAALAIKGNLYIALAKRIALQLNMDTAASSLRELVDTRDNTNIDQMLMTTLQWCNIVILEAKQEASIRSPPNSYKPSPSVDFALETLKLALDRGYMPGSAYFLYHRLASSMQLMQGVGACTKNWKRLDKLADIILDHEARCVQEREEVATALQTLFPSSSTSTDADERAFAISQLCTAAIHARHTDLVGICMFYAIMAASTQQQQEQQQKQEDAHHQSLDPAEAIHIGEHIITRLKDLRPAASRSTDHHHYHHQQPQQPPRPTPIDIRLFLTRFGSHRMHDLERTLADFIAIASTGPDTNDDDDDNDNDIIVPFIPPLRAAAAEVLHRCKNVVENNAVRLKAGWDGGLHERVDTQLVLLEECARRLEGMEVDGEGDAQGVSVCKASARLVRSLGRIVRGWRRGLVVEGRRRGRGREEGEATAAVEAVGEVGAGGEGGGDGDGAGDGMGKAGAELDGLLGGDLFADWSNWPQMDAFDFSTLFADDSSWELV